jgi:hypothetical protein
MSGSIARLSSPLCKRQATAAELSMLRKCRCISEAASEVIGELSALEKYGRDVAHRGWSDGDALSAP